MSLPDGVIGPIVDSDFGDVVSLLIAIDSETRSYNDISDNIQEIENRLKRLPAVRRLNGLASMPKKLRLVLMPASWPSLV